jgi:hypothetical protein
MYLKLYISEGTQGSEKKKFFFSDLCASVHLVIIFFYLLFFTCMQYIRICNIYNPGKILMLLAKPLEKKSSVSLQKYIFL